LIHFYKRNFQIEKGMVQMYQSPKNSMEGGGSLA